MSNDIDGELVMMERIGRGDFTRLLYCNPRSPVSDEPTDDDLTATMERAFSTAIRGPAYRGWHTCACGERSGNSDYVVADRWLTNTLCVHYLRWHRAEIPASELNKVREIAGLPVVDVPANLPPVKSTLDEFGPLTRQPSWRSPSCGTGAIGLFQTMPSWHQRGSATDLPPSPSGPRFPEGENPDA